MSNAISLGEKGVGSGHPCFVIAEAGVNHNGDLALARRLIEVAAESGADAVKFQSFRAEKLATRSAPKAAYQLGGTEPAESQYEMLRRLELTPEAHRALIEHCQASGILFLSTPFDESSADLLEDLGVPAYKLPSGEVTNTPMLAHVARKGKPILLSTGMSYLSEVEVAVRAIRDAADVPLVLLHCVSNYPADVADVNLRAMETMRRAFGVPVGYSDHTEGEAVTLAAVALGASVIEKHFTLDRDLPGPDHRASLEPAELASLIRGVRAVEDALGHGRKEPAFSEAGTAAVARKSLVAAVDLVAGAVLRREDIAMMRPGTGLAPALVDQVVGRRMVRDLAAGDLLTWDALG